MEETYKQLFIGGDLSGIQSFLYNISSKQAAVSLKGRSFYLQQYMENVCKTIEQAVKQAGAKDADVIYCSGGKFYMLTENSEIIRHSVDDAAIQLRKALWTEHLGQLGLNIAYVPFTEHPEGKVDAAGNTNQKPGLLWQIANEEFSKQKNQKFKEVIENAYHEFFEPIPVGGKVRLCAVTGIESPDCVIIPGDEGQEMYVLPSVRQQIQLGKELRNQQHFKTFEEYADKTDLGVLRMDLDNLGKRFVAGFDSIAQYKAFSQRLVGFFDVELNRIRQEPTFRDYLNIIYAGGDDLFVVGRWDKTIDFAERISKTFKAQFTDEGISMSGGMAVVHPKHPIAKAAELAGDAEDAAKQFKSGEKNAFCFLGKTVSWNEEFDYVRSYQQQFVSLIAQYGLSKGILHKLMLYSSIANRNKLRKKEGKAEDFSYIWHISYYLTRYITRYKDNDAVCAFCRQLRDHDIDYRDGRRLELIALAARWAELILKDDLNN
jgi:CRISPR/Cas system-associated protein Cas10 (large subunit of type III CRISPR-Cas system)